MSVRETLAELGVRPSRGLGQNFLIHPDTGRRIAGSASVHFATAAEIGPGLGALTAALLETGACVAAAEIDHRLHEYLRERIPPASGRLQLIRADALKLDWPAWLVATPAPRVLFGNLPYSISAPVIEKIFQTACLFSQAVLCLQTEVADRILSSGGRGMGPITLLAHRFCARREKLFRIPPGGFYPTPKVSSTVIRLVFNAGVDWSELDRRIPRLLFSRRRKILSSVLPRGFLTTIRQASSRRIDEMTVEEAGTLAEELRDHFDSART